MKSPLILGTFPHWIGEDELEVLCFFEYMPGSPRIVSQTLDGTNDPGSDPEMNVYDVHANGKSIVDALSDETIKGLILEANEKLANNEFKRIN